MGTNISTLKPNSIEHIVFSGGSVKAIAHCGAITALHKRGLLYDTNNNLMVKSFAGTSAGSIIASLVAVGYMPDELCTIMRSMDLEKLVETEYRFTELYNLAEKIGAHTGSALYESLGSLIATKTGNKDYTIQQLFDDKAVTLVITTTDLNCQKTVYFYPNHNDKLYRDVPIRLAIRMSMSIPGFFCPIIYDGNYHIDGGILNNYPIRVFDGSVPDDEKAYRGDCQPNTRVIGFNIITDHDLSTCRGKQRDEITGWSTFLPLLVNVGMVDNIRKELNKADLARTISIITPDISPIRFNITDKEKDELIRIGMESVEKYFMHQ